MMAFPTTRALPATAASPSADPATRIAAHGTKVAGGLIGCPGKDYSIWDRGEQA
jgi:hypothetical protein